MQIELPTRPYSYGLTYGPKPVFRYALGTTRSHPPQNVRDSALLATRGYGLRHARMVPLCASLGHTRRLGLSHGPPSVCVIACPIAPPNPRTQPLLSWRPHIRPLGRTITCLHGPRHPRDYPRCYRRHYVRPMSRPHALLLSGLYARWSVRGITMSYVRHYGLMPARLPGRGFGRTDRRWHQRIIASSFTRVTARAHMPDDPQQHPRPDDPGCGGAVGRTITSTHTLDSGCAARCVFTVQPWRFATGANVRLFVGGPVRCHASALARLHMRAHVRSCGRTSTYTHARRVVRCHTQTHTLGL